MMFGMPQLARSSQQGGYSDPGNDAHRGRSTPAGADGDGERDRIFGVLPLASGGSRGVHVNSAGRSTLHKVQVGGGESSVTPFGLRQNRVSVNDRDERSNKS